MGDKSRENLFIELGWLIVRRLKDERVLSQPETTAIWEQSLQ